MPVPFEEKTSDAYAEWVESTFESVTSRDGSIALVGACPRCEHAMEYLIASTVTRTWVRRVAGLFGRPPSPPAPGPPPPAPGEEVERMICTCDHEHAGRPADYLGCGAYWDLVVSAA